MLGLRWRTDAQARWKNGQPHHSTTGVVRMSCTQLTTRMSSRPCSGRPGSMSAIASRKTGRLRTSPTQKRRLMSVNSGFGPSSTVRGSRAMPHFGQLPGWSLITSGCMGQTYSTRSAGGPAGSRAMPHFGQTPG